jgi:hypothetical protein
MKTKKIIIMALIFVVTIMTCITTVNATIDPNKYKPGNLTAEDYQKPFEFAGTIVNAIVTVGVVISIVTTMVLGIKYMMGSVEEKAEYKQTMGPVIFGMVMLFCTSTIVALIYNIMFNVNKSI